MKRALIEKINGIESELIELSLQIHQNPELAFEEHLATKNLTQYLEHYGFKIMRQVGGLETAFVAEYKGEKKGPIIGYLAEYDALPGIGHACGHNLIATMSAGAAIGLASVVDAIGGTVRVIGTPAEEGGGGKIMMCNQGVFDDVDYAMMIHPATENIICRGGLATRSVTIEYSGKAAHSASAESGINALNAVIQTFNLLDASRTLMPTGTNINGIIINGGTASNIIPDRALCKFSVRAVDIADLKKVIHVFDRVVAAVDALIGTSSKIRLGLIYSERYPNKPMAEALRDNLRFFDEVMHYPNPKMKIGSSDIGNVSLKLPTIHSYLKIAEAEVKAHSKDFEIASSSEYALKQMIKGAKGLAMTGYDILTSEDLRNSVQLYFDENVPVYSRDELY